MTFSVMVNEDNSIGMIHLDTELTDSGEWFRNHFFSPNFWENLKWLS